MTTERASFSRGSYDGVAAAALAARLGVCELVALDTTPSTLDVAHALAAAGAPDGTLVLADTQTAGRGRSGKRWISTPGTGIWLTMVERRLDPATISLLALRLGIAAADALEPFTTGFTSRFTSAAIGVKWPNDLYLGQAKLAGILVEARWRDGAPEWVAIGIGVNVRPPAELQGAAGLRPGVSRLEVLDVLVPALCAASVRTGELSSDELSSLARRDIARGRAAVAPSQGVVDGVSPAGELVIRAPDGAITSHRSGSLVFAEAP